MLFSSPVFLFGFLPLAFFLHALMPATWRNACLFVLSAIFYAWGEAWLVWLLLASIVGNQAFAVAIWRLDTPRADPQGLLLPAMVEQRCAHGRTLRRWLLLAAIAFNLGLLGYFKYANFFVLDILQGDANQWRSIALPIGISFYTFQGMSYVMDVYRREVSPARTVVDFGAYIASFPQLIAGPIVRYAEIREALARRRITLDDVYSGSRRFTVGLGKKMLIANPAGLVADQIYAMPVTTLDAPHAWLAMLAYAIQIYFDFSGYSDMAIGLGRMLGFRFPENFHYPYMARSVQDFWRRWHMTLTRWFRDYVYIPLGGNRVSPLRTAANKWLVFLLCGFWHGASWNFLVWGAYHGCFLVLEEGTRLKKLGNFVPAWGKHAYALCVILVGWVFFRAESLPQALAVLTAALGLGDGAPAYALTRFWRGDTVLALALGVLLSVPLASLAGRLGLRMASRPWRIAADCCLLGILVISCAFVVASTFNPFLYFRF